MKRPLAEALVVFAIATVANVALYQLSAAVPFLARNLQVAVAIVFLYLPAAVAWRRRQDLAAFGFTYRPLGRSLAFGLGGPAIIFPLFLVGFVLFYTRVCDPHAPSFLAWLSPRALCPRFAGWSALAHPQLPDGFLSSVFNEVVVTALPEELFFRGYLLARLEEAFPPRRRILGGGVGVALVLSSLLFALGHVFLYFTPGRLAVFFPALLFGWMRSATGSILAGTIAHASANLYIDVLQRTFFV